MISLTHLNVSHNHLESLSLSKKDMGSLTYLDVSHNQLSSFMCWRSLIHLDISNNNLTSLSDCLKDMNSLSVLAISHNRLTYLPRFLQNMDSLKEIRISYNQFECKCDLVWLEYSISRNSDTGNKGRSIYIPDYSVTTCRMDSGKFIAIYQMIGKAMGCEKRKQYFYMSLAEIITSIMLFMLLTECVNCFLPSNDHHLTWLINCKNKCTA